MSRTKMETDSYANRQVMETDSYSFTHYRITEKNIPAPKTAIYE